MKEETRGVFAKPILLGLLCQASLILVDVKGYHEKVLRPDLTVMVVVGDVSADEARSMVEKYSGGWKATGPRLEIDHPHVSLNKRSETAVPDGSRVQDAFGRRIHPKDVVQASLGQKPDWRASLGNMTKIRKRREGRASDWISVHGAFDPIYRSGSQGGI